MLEGSRSLSLSTPYDLPKQSSHAEPTTSKPRNLVIDWQGRFQIDENNRPERDATVKLIYVESRQPTLSSSMSFVLTEDAADTASTMRRISMA